MPQTGVHALAGLGASPLSSLMGDRKLARAFVFGLVLGNFIPDADFFLVVPVYLFNAKFAPTLHRSVTHSLLTIAAVLLVAALLGGVRREWRWLGFGIGLGMLMHTTLDLFMFFSGVDLLWPLGYWGIPSKVTLVGKPAAWVDNLVNNAGDYAAFALYFMALRALARKYGTNLDYLPRLGYWIGVLWWLVIPYALASFFLSTDDHNFIHYGLYTLVFLPLCIYVTFRMRPTLDALADSLARRPPRTPSKLMSG